MSSSLLDNILNNHFEVKFEKRLRVIFENLGYKLTSIRKTIYDYCICYLDNNGKERIMMIPLENWDQNE